MGNFSKKGSPYKNHRFQKMGSRLAWGSFYQKGAPLIKPITVQKRVLPSYMGGRFTKRGYPYQHGHFSKKGDATLHGDHFSKMGSHYKHGRFPK